MKTDYIEKRNSFSDIAKFISGISEFDKRVKQASIKLQEIRNNFEIMQRDRSEKIKSCLERINLIQEDENKKLGISGNFEIF